MIVIKRLIVPFLLFSNIVMAFDCRVFFTLVGTDDFNILYPSDQPKLRNGDLVEAHGIRVPRRYTSLLQATIEGKKFILRSEHRDEYTGISGLLPSIVVNERMIPIILNHQKTGPLEHLIDDTKRTRDKDRLYALLIAKYIQDRQGIYFNTEMIKATGAFTSDMARELPGAYKRKLIAEMSFSYWEYIEGTNWTVISDHVVPNRYHIFSSKLYVVIENGRVIFSNQDPIAANIQSQLPSLVRFYEKTRSLPFYSRKQNPMIEIQYGEDGNLYFLQYHRQKNTQTQNFHIPKTTLADFERGWVSADFVIGQTPRDGVTLEITVSFKSNKHRETWDSLVLYKMYRGILEKYPYRIWFDGLDNFKELVPNHIVRRQLFGPDIYLVVNFFNLLQPKYILPLIRAVENKSQATIKIRMISDGNHARIKIVDITIHP